MTLIIGIKCVDGIVLGADSAQTMPGYIQQSTRKIEIIGSDFVIGSSGSGHIAHQFRWAIEEAMASPEFCTENLQAASNSLRQAIWPIVERNFSETAFLRQRSTQPANFQDPTTYSLVALLAGRTPTLLSFNENGSPIEITADSVFGCLGSGCFAANPFLGFIKRIWWVDHNPSVAEGILATVWTLEHSIKVSSGGVADPKQLVVFSSTDGEWRAKELSSNELDEHHQAVNELERKLATDLSEFFKATPQDPTVADIQ